MLVFPKSYCFVVFPGFCIEIFLNLEIFSIYFDDNCIAAYMPSHLLDHSFQKLLSILYQREVH